MRTNPGHLSCIRVRDRRGVSRTGDERRGLGLVFLVFADGTGLRHGPGPPGPVRPEHLRVSPGGLPFFFFSTHDREEPYCTWMPCRGHVAEPLLRLRDVGEWRAWLAAHHRESTGAVLLVSKKAVSHGVHYEEALEEALCFGWIDGRLHAHDPERFALRFSRRRPDSIWSESNRDRATRLVKEERMQPAGLAAIEAGKRSGAWQSAYRVSREPALPRDLRDALRSDPKAWAHYQAWGTTYRTACIHWVTDAKKEVTRTKRIRRVVERAAEDRRPGIDGW